MNGKSSRVFASVVLAAGIVSTSVVGASAQEPATVADVVAGTASGAVSIDGAALIQDAPGEFYFGDGTGVVEIELESSAASDLPLMTLVNIVGSTDGTEIDVDSWTALDLPMPADIPTGDDVVSAFQAWVTAAGAAGAADASAALARLAATEPSQAVVRCGGLRATRVGTNGNNVIYGTNGRDVIHGRGGNDEIYGRGGNDVICGGGGNDDIEGGPGRDKLKGNSGNDEIYGKQGNDKLVGGGGFDEGKGGPGNDTCRQIERRYGC